MDLYVARQPIFNIKREVVAYELLYRSSLENSSSFSDGDAATLSVINNTAFAMGMDTLTDGRRAFINFTKNLIIDDIPSLFQKEAVVVEILEDIIPDEAFIEACKKLKERGYILALDDFVMENEWAYPLMDLVDIIKVDFMLTTAEERRHIVQRFSNGKVRFLAEKVETEDVFAEAVAAGYHYFQGYFFSRPVVVRGKDIKSFATNYLQVMSEISKPEADFDKIAQIIETDLSMSYKLMRLVNSPAFYSVSKVKSIKQALARLGQKEIRKWTSVLMLRDMSKDKPDEVARMSLLRGKFAELIAERLNLLPIKQEMFLTGLFSMLDVMMERPFGEILAEMPLADAIKEALMGMDNQNKRIMDVILTYEKADWHSFEMACLKVGLKAECVTDDYYSALGWTRELFGEVGQY